MLQIITDVFLYFCRN